MPEIIDINNGLLLGLGLAFVNGGGAMGFLNIFSRKEDDARKATLDELVRQTAAERTRIRQDLAALDARRASAESWLAASRAAIVTDYGRLLDAFLSNDAAAVGRAIAAADDRLPVVAAIPVYYSDGVTTVTFAAMAAQVFPDHPGLAQRLAAEPGALPPAALSARRMEEFYKPDETAMDSLFLKDPDKVKKMSGSYRENVDTWTGHFRMVLDGLKINGPADIARKEAALNEFLRAELDKITVTAGRHRALVDAFDRGDADGAVNTLAALKKSQKLADLLAMGTGRADVADFTAMALRSFADPRAVLRVYAATVAAGQPVHLDAVAARVLTPPHDLPPQMLSLAMTAVLATDKKQSAMGLMTARLADGTPWLAAAAHDEKLTEAVLAAAGDDARLRAAALLSAADMAGDSAVAGKMRARADALTVHGGFVTVARNVRVRAASVDHAAYAEGSLRYNVNGEGWYDRMTEESGRATLRVLAARPDMTAVNAKAVINAALGINIWAGRNGPDHVTAMTPSQTYGFNSTAGDAATVIARFAARPGWITAANEAFNARAVDNAWPQDGKQNSIKFLGMGREYYGPVAPSAVPAVFDALIAEDPALERVGSEIVRMPVVAYAALARDGDVNKLDLTMRRHGGLHVVVSEDEGIAALKRLESAHGHIFISPWQTLAPSVTDHLRVRTKDSDKSALSVTLDGKSYAVPGVDSARAQALLRETVRLLPHFHEAVAGKLVVNMRHVDAVTLTAEGLNFITGDKTVTGTGSRDIFARVAAGHGLLRITDRLAVNPARINLMFHDDGKLTLSGGKGRIALPVSVTQGARIMDAVCAAPAPAAPDGNAERGLSAAFACEPAWPAIVEEEKEKDGACAPPPYSEKPSPR